MQLMPDPGTKPPPRRGRLLLGLCTLLLLLVLAGIVIRLTVRDGIAAIAPVFYAFPPLAMAGACFLAAIGFARRRAHRRGVLTALLMIGLIAWGVGRNASLRNHIDEPDGIAVCMWNVSRGWAGWDDIIAVLADDGADVVGLVDATMDEAGAAALRAAMPEHTLIRADHGLAALVRGECGQPLVIPLGERSRCMRLDVRVNGLDLAVLLVDIDSNPLAQRGEPLRSLHKIAAGISDRPVVIMGDFNTPGDSVHFDDWRKQYHNAGGAFGCGWKATWPVFAPILQIDHIWLSNSLEAQRCRAGWSFQSDHRRLMAVIAKSE
jgi:endonuclease/exonuclease/phosphatase (EEP) superfamily protein YafD